MQAQPEEFSVSANWSRQGRIINETAVPDAATQANLETLRNEIDEIDTKLADLLARRFALTEEIGKTKQKLGRPLKDQARENEVLKGISHQLGRQNSHDFVLNVFRSLFKESIDHQEAMTSAEDNRTRSERLFPNVCVIGAGLIGGALSRRIKSIFPNTRLTAVDLPDSLPALQASSLFDKVVSEPDKAILENVSLIILACPPDTSLEVLKKIAPLLSPGQLVIDLCSAKGEICKLAEQLDLNGAEFVGGHPFFGTEKSGFVNSHEVQLGGRTFCIVPGSKSSELSTARLRLWLSSMEMRVFITDAKSHDATVAVTSHLIQLIAGSLGSLIHDELLSNNMGDHLVLSGGALSGLSRLMSSSPQLWLQISRQNRKAISTILEKFNARIKKLIAPHESESFAESFDKASAVRQALQEI